MNPKTDRIKKLSLSIISAFSLITVLMQGIPALAGLQRDFIWTSCILLFLPVPVFLLVLHKKGRLTEETAVYAIIYSGMLFHCCYVLLSGLYDRQHDEGVYTGIATSQINPGHIGYIEYIYKFRKLPDMNPYQLFSYYHPPLHYVLAGIWLLFLTALGMPENLAFENLQTLPLFYSGLFMFLTYLILKKVGAKGKPLYLGLSLVAFHPALTIMSGSINNDMLSTLLLACCIYAVLCWIREKNLKNLILIALSIGLGMICKINTAVIALPTGLIFLLDFIGTVRTGDKHSILRSVKHYILFGITSGTIGLSWIIRNLIRFHIKPGISSATEASVMYTGKYGIWERIGIPAFADWHFSFPFHPLSGDVIHNTWVIMFQTSLFTEVYPQELTGVPLMLCRLAYPLAIFAAVSSAILFFAVQYRKASMAFETSSLTKHPGRLIGQTPSRFAGRLIGQTPSRFAGRLIGQTPPRSASRLIGQTPPRFASRLIGQKAAGFEAIFLSAGYLAFLLSFAVFTLKYPYTCSSDFRYIVICLVYIAIGLADSSRFYPGKSKSAAILRIIHISVWATLLLTTVIYMVWNQW